MLISCVFAAKKRGFMRLCACLFQKCKKKLEKYNRKVGIQVSDILKISDTYKRDK